MKGDALIKLLGAFALGGIVGWYVIPMIVGSGGQAQAQAARAARAGGPAPAYRIAGDFLNACDQLRPFMLQLQQETTDGDLDTAGIFRLYQQAQRLTG